MTGNFARRPRFLHMRHPIRGGSLEQQVSAGQRRAPVRADLRRRGCDKPTLPPLVSGRYLMLPRQAAQYHTQEIYYEIKCSNSSIFGNLCLST